MTKSVRDVIVVMPGIMGSALSRDGVKVWDSTPGTILANLVDLGRRIKDLQLPDGIRDNKPDDGIEPVGLVYDLHVIPGTSKPITGYTKIVAWLNREFDLRPTGAGPREQPGNLWLFAYDWRLSNRYNARKFKKDAETVLGQWQTRSGNHDAKLILICHSMGGLIARYFLEVLGGHAITRRLITMGTPYRGSVDALDKLVNGADIHLGPLALNFSNFTRSLPSIFELLPDYACMETDAGLKTIGEIAPQSLDSSMLADARHFHEEIRKAVGTRSNRGYTTHAVVGIRQPTLTTARLNNGAVELLNTYEGSDEGGDGTVPRLSARPEEVESDSAIQTYCAEQHGSLTVHSGIHEHLYGVITSEHKVYRDAPAGAEVGLTIPEFAPGGSELTIDVVSKADDLVPVAAMIDSQGRTIVSRIAKNLGAGRYTVTFEGLQPDLYSVRVAAADSTQPIKPVTGFTLVWE